MDGELSLKINQKSESGVVGWHIQQHKRSGCQAELVFGKVPAAPGHSYLQFVTAMVTIPNWEQNSCAGGEAAEPRAPCRWG